MLDKFKLKRAPLNASANLPTRNSIQVDKLILSTSYEVVYLIAKQGKPHTLGKTFIKPAALKMVNTMLGKAGEDTLSLVPLPNDTISSRIHDMSDDILAQIVQDLVTSPTKFILQLGETTGVSNLSQLLYLCVMSREMRSRNSFCFASLSQQQRRQLTWRTLWVTSSKAMVFRGTWCLPRRGSSQAGAQIQFLSDGEAQCTTHRRHAQCPAQTRVGT